MERLFQFSRLLAIGVVLVVLTGCGSENSISGLVEASASPIDKGHDHGESHQGPHGGHVIELGRNHEFHAEMLEDDASESICIYVLDKDLNELPIEQESVALNVTMDGKANCFELTAIEPTNGKSSRFRVSEKSLFRGLQNAKETTGKLRVTIADKAMVGVIHHHAHGAHHDHAHNDADHAHQQNE